MQNKNVVKQIILGNIYNNNFKGGYAGNVWAVSGVSPTLRTFQGGNSQPLIVIKHARASKNKTSD